MVEILSFNTFVCNNYFYVYLVLRQNLLTSLTTHLFSQQPTYSMRGDKMINKEQIKKLRDNAELAWAAYGYFDRLKYNYAQDEDSKKALKEFREIKKDENATITPADILDITYKYHLDEDGKPKDGIIFGFFADELFSGDMSPFQAKKFFERYDLLIHQPNTSNGFSATLFGEKKKTKEYRI